MHCELKCAVPMSAASGFSAPPTRCISTSSAHGRSISASVAHIGCASTSSTHGLCPSITAAHTHCPMARAADGCCFLVMVTHPAQLCCTSIRAAAHGRCCSASTADERPSSAHAAPMDAKSALALLRDVASASAKAPMGAAGGSQPGLVMPSDVVMQAAAFEGPACIQPPLGAEGASAAWASAAGSSTARGPTPATSSSGTGGSSAAAAAAAAAAPSAAALLTWRVRRSDTLPPAVTPRARSAKASAVYYFVCVACGSTASVW